jgi:predicted nucleic acid-binding protein
VEKSGKWPVCGRPGKGFSEGTPVLIIDTDVLVWYLRGSESAKKAVEENLPFSVSVVTLMELMQGMKNKEEMKRLQKQMRKWNVNIIQIDKEVSARAMFYVQEYALSHSMMLADGLIAATVVQNGETLLTANEKHYKFIPAMECRKFRPISTIP